MTLIIEVSKPIQWRPGYFKSRIMTRVWWLYVAVALVRVPANELMDTNRFYWDRRVK